MDQNPDNNSAQPSARTKRKLTAAGRKEERIRVELNVEKWPGMWRPASAKTAPAARVLEREIQLNDGTRGTSKLEIGFTQFGTITTEDQRMFVALIEHWEKNGKPADRPVFFSDRLLARLLRKKGWGSNVITAITESLRRLRTTPLRWINSFRRKDGSGKEYAEETYFNFLDTLKIVTRREDGHVTNQQGYFQFDKNILGNLLHNYTKPLRADEFFRLKTEIGQLLYTHVDLIMSDKTRYERCTKELFADLGLLENPSYRYPSNRKQALKGPVAELVGKRLSTGTLKAITLERTKDDKDYKLVFVKSRTAPMEETAVAEISATAPVVVNHYRSAVDARLQEQAEALVRHFHVTVHGVKNIEPAGRELDQACALIAKHGWEQSKHVIDFAFARAQETKFPMQHFGAILSYASRALASFLQAPPAEAQSGQPAKPQPMPAVKLVQFRRGEARLALLGREQYDCRFEAAKGELFREIPFVAQHWNPDSKIHQDMIRRRMVRQLEYEPMELLVIENEVGRLVAKLGAQN